MLDLWSKIALVPCRQRAGEVSRETGENLVNYINGHLCGRRVKKKMLCILSWRLFRGGTKEVRHREILRKILRSGRFGFTP